MVCIVNLGPLADAANNQFNTFDAQDAQDSLALFEIPEFDRDYLFAVMSYLFPGFITALTRIASNRHVGVLPNVDNNVAGGNFADTVLANNQGFAPVKNNKALRHLQRAFGLIAVQDPAELNLATHRRDGSVRATLAYQCAGMCTAFNRNRL